MKYVEEYWNANLIHGLAGTIREKMSRVDSFTVMEVCGTHTMSFYRHGLRSLLPQNLRLLSGPGCPVCVTPICFIDEAIALSRLGNVTVATFGDLVRVPGSASSLDQERAQGRSIVVVYSPQEAVALAENRPDREIIFLGVGFETTAPAIALAILEAKAKGLRNFTVLTAHKTMPQAMRALVSDPSLRIQGFLCPAHVSTIIGAGPYQFIAEEFHIPCVIAGFEPLDMMEGLLMLANQHVGRRAEVENQYKRVAHMEGNRKAQRVLSEVFEEEDSEWRGLGVIRRSGLRLRPAYRDWDARERFSISVAPSREPKGCRCGDILRGVVTPAECPLFGKACTPERPVGACMVSSEGTCAAHYRYN